MFTSYLAIYELISGVSAKNYNERRAILCNTSKSKLVIDWRSLSQIMAHAFREEDPSDLRPEVIRQVMNIFLSSSTFGEAERRCVMHRLDIHGIVYDRSAIIERYRRARVQDSLEFRSEFTPEIQRIMFGSDGLKGRAAEIRKLNDEIAPELDVKLLTEAATICAGRISAAGRPCTYDELLARYDGTLKWSIQASRFVQTEALPTGNTPARNDMIDILHFLYVNEGTILISEDSLSIKICDALWPERRMSLEAFKDILSQ